MPLGRDNAPRKSRDLLNCLIDTRLWDEFAIRPDDIIIATYAKAGTTWAQQIAGQLVFNGDENVHTSALSPWLELRMDPKQEKFDLLAAQTHRRFYKSHAPADTLPMSPRAKYIYVCRDGRDIVWSLYNMHMNFMPAYYVAINAPPGPYGPALTPPQCAVDDYFRTWLDHDGRPWWSFWDNVRSWWALRDCANVLLVHFADLKKDLAGEIARIAGFLDYDPAVLDMTRITAHCTFDYMKREAERMTPGGGARLRGGAGSFIYKGSNGRWRASLAADDCARYLATAKAELGAACAAWVAEGNAAS